MKCLEVLFRTLALTVACVAVSARAAPGGNPIPPSGPPIKLQASDLEPAHPERAPLPHVPLTYQDLNKAMGAKFVSFQGEPAVTLKDGSVMPVVRYLQLFNKWEAYLNKLGYTLRDGPLAVPQRAHGRERLTPGHSVDPYASATNLGVVLRLHDTLQNRHGNWGRDVDKATRKPLREPIEDPLAHLVNRGGPEKVELGGRTVGLNPILNQGPLARQLASRAKRTPFKLILPGGIGDVTTHVMSGEMNCGAPQVKGCRCLEGTPNCSNGVEVAPDGTVIVDCGTALAGVGGTSDAPRTNTDESDGIACNEWSAGDPACMYDPHSELHAKWTGIHLFDSAGDTSDWFNVGMRMDMGFAGDGQGGSFTLGNAAESSFDVVLFKHTIHLLQGSATSAFDGQQHTSSADIVVPLTGEKLGADGYQGHYDMPPVIIPIAGIANLSLTGGGGARLGYSDFQAPYSAWPTTCSAGSGTLGLHLTETAQADLTLDAHIDAVIAKAGVEGTLMLADNSFTMEMMDTVEPGKNKITVQPHFVYDTHYLAGKVYAYIEIDALVYTKRFEIKLFDFNGIDPDPKSPKTDAKVFSAKATQ